MRPVLRQALANIRSRPLQSALIFTTILVSTGLLMLGLVARGSAGEAWNTLHHRSGEPHLWIELDSRQVEPEEARRRIATVAGIDEVGPVLRSIELRALGIEGIFSSIHVREWPARGGLGESYLVEGRRPRGGDRAEVVLDRNLAVSEGFAVGETLAIPVSPQARLDLDIVGLAVTPENCPHPVCNPTFVYTAPGSLTALDLDPPPAPDAVSDSVAVHLADADRADAAATRIDAVLPAGAIEDFETWEYVRNVTEVVTSVQTLLFGGFGVVTVLLSGVLIVNAVGGAVRTQARNVGLLKAVGFTGRQLAGVYLVEYLGVALLASVLGAGAGVLASAPMLRPVTAQFGVAAAPVAAGEVAFVVAAVVTLTAIFTALPVRRVARLDAVAAIRTGAERPRRRGRSLARLPVPIAHGLADVTSRPARALVTGTGLLVTAVALVWVVVANSTMSTIFSDPDVTFYGDADVVALRSGLVDDERARQIINRHPDVDSVLIESSNDFSFSGDAERFQARYLDGDLESFPAPLIEGRMFTGDGEAVAGYGLARNRGLEVGDVTVIEIADHRHEIEITGIVREFNNLGELLTMPAETIGRIDPEVGAEIYAVQLRDGAAVSGFAADIEEASGGLLGTAPLDRSALPKTLRDAQGVIFALSGVMVLTVAVGILGSVSLSVAERRRELGMLKAVGMTPAQVLQSVLTGAGVLALGAVALGLPLGVLLSRTLSGGITRGIGLGPMDPAMPLGLLALLVPVILGMTLLGAAVPARSAARVDPIAVLRYE